MLLDAVSRLSSEIDSSYKRRIPLYRDQNSFLINHLKHCTPPPSPPYHLGFLYSLDSWVLVILYSWGLVFLYQVGAFMPYPKWRWRGRPVASRAGCGGCRASTPVSGLKPRDGAFPFPNAEGDLYAHLRELPYGLWRALGRT